MAAVWDWAQDKLLFPKNGKYIRSLNESETDTGLEGRAWDKEWYSWYLQVLSVQPRGGRPAHIPTWSLAVFFQSFSLLLTFSCRLSALQTCHNSLWEFTSPECSSLIMRLAGVDVAGKITAFLISTDSHSQPKSTELPATTIMMIYKKRLQTRSLKQDLMKQANDICMLCKL